MEKRKTALFPLHKESHFLIFCILMLCLMGIAMFSAMRMGSVEIDPDTIKGVLVNKLTSREYYPVTWDYSLESIVWDIRTPRVFTAFIVGAGLTMCGILMQVLTKNSLADPYVLGISHGASAGAVSVIMYGYLWFLGGYGTMAGAFLGALISITLAMKIASVRKKITATQLVLAGIAVSALFGAITNLMIYHTKTGSDKVKTASYWMMGSLSGSSWEKLKYATIAFLVCFALIMTFPHITRSIVGTKHRRLVPAAVLVGGTFLVVADIISRVIVAPEELPIGVVSAFFGAPFFLYLIRKGNKKAGG